jgi:hypothetical protein
MIYDWVFSTTWYTRLPPPLPLRASEVWWVLIACSLVRKLSSFKLHPSHFTLPSCPALGWCLSGHGSLAARSLIMSFVPIINDRRPCRHGHHAAASMTAAVLILPRSTNHRPILPPLNALRPASLKSGGKSLGPVGESIARRLHWNIHERFRRDECQSLRPRSIPGEETSYGFPRFYGWHLSDFLNPIVPWQHKATVIHLLSVFIGC